MVKEPISFTIADGHGSFYTANAAADSGRNPWLDVSRTYLHSCYLPRSKEILYHFNIWWMNGTANRILEIEFTPLPHCKMFPFIIKGLKKRDET